MPLKAPLQLNGEWFILKYLDFFSVVKNHV